MILRKESWKKKELEKFRKSNGKEKEKEKEILTKVLKKVGKKKKKKKNRILESREVELFWMEND